MSQTGAMIKASLRDKLGAPAQPSETTLRHSISPKTGAAELDDHFCC